MLHEALRRGGGKSPLSRISVKYAKISQNSLQISLNFSPNFRTMTGAAKGKKFEANTACARDSSIGRSQQLVTGRGVGGQVIPTPLHV